MSRLRTIRTVGTVVLAAIAAASCGYFVSGTWDDVPENWGRAFRSAKPDNVVIVHSHYWRAPHFTYEAGYLFELLPNAALRSQLFGQNRLRKLTGPEITDTARPCFGECPPWFAPKPLASYDVWVYADLPDSNFQVLIDKKTLHIFIGNYEV